MVSQLRRRATASRRAAFVGALLVAVGCGSGHATTNRPAAVTPRPAAVAPPAQPRTGAASASTPAPQQQPTPQSFTIAATGDLLIHMPVANRAKVDGQASGKSYDFSPMLARVRGQLSKADLAVCHVETPLSADDTNISGYPVFNTPHELVDAIKATGWESCSTASNHSIDHGETGVRATLDWLDKVGGGHAGTARSAQEAQRVEMHTVNGVRVGLLAYTYGTNGVPVPAATPWLVNLVNVPKILADAHAARLAGAQFVAVSMHWGQENQTAPTALQRSQAAALLASPDVDLIIGDHVHVVQPIERIGSKYVIYGLGNFLSNQTSACCPASSQDGIIATATLTAAAGGRWTTTVRYTPTWVDIGPYVVHPVAADLDDPTTPAALRSALQVSWSRTVAAVTSLPGHAHDATPDLMPR